MCHIVLVAILATACSMSEELDDEICDRCDEVGGVALADPPQRLTNMPLGKCWTEGNLAICQNQLLTGHAGFKVGTGSGFVDMRSFSGGPFEAYISDIDTIETLEFVGWGESIKDTFRATVQYGTTSANYRPGEPPVILPGPDFFVIGLVSKNSSSLSLEVVYTLGGKEIVESNRWFQLQREAVLNSNHTVNVHRSYLPIDPGSTVEIDEANGGICWGIDLDEADWINVDGCPSVLQPGELATFWE